MPSTVQEYFRMCCDHIGASKMIWGTDLPSILTWSTYAQNLDWIKAMIVNLSLVERDAILWKNAAEVYGFKDIGEKKTS